MVVFHFKFYPEIMKKTLLMLAFGLFTANLATAQSKDAQVKIKTSAVCGMCKKTIEKYLAYEKGVQSSDLDVKSKTVTVTYNPKKTDVAKIKKAINKSGYDADETTADAKSYDQLEECCKKTAPPHTDQ